MTRRSPHNNSQIHSLESYGRRAWGDEAVPAAGKGFQSGP